MIGNRCKTAVFDKYLSEAGYPFKPCDSTSAALCEVQRCCLLHYFPKFESLNNMNKRQKVERLLRMNKSKVTRRKIAEQAGCTGGYVSMVASDMGLTNCFEPRPQNLLSPYHRRRPTPSDFYKERPHYNYRVLSVEEWIAEVTELKNAPKRVLY